MLSVHRSKWGMVYWQWFITHSVIQWPILLFHIREVLLLIVGRDRRLSWDPSVSSSKGFNSTLQIVHNTLFLHLKLLLIILFLLQQVSVKKQLRPSYWVHWWIRNRKGCWRKRSCLIFKILFRHSFKGTEKTTVNFSWNKPTGSSGVFQTR
jgi:hypothetical protein